MTTWAVLATGPSMSQAVADAVRGKCRVVAVSDAYMLAPWADALVSTDAAWWAAHPDAKNFEGIKYTGAPAYLPVPGVTRAPWGDTGTNSGLLACKTAYAMGASRILLCGFDMHGTHFFGTHPPGLGNTTPERFVELRKQFDVWRPRNVEVLNCTPGSALQAYPFADLHEALAL